MRRALGLAAAVVLAASLLAAARPGRASPAADWMPVTEIRPGMRGQARTVVRGTRVESFDVEALAVVPGGGPAGDLILIRASGPLVQRTGGIAAGMSGSPVFFNGRLAGAIGYGWAFADHTVGLVTPIADMLRSMPPPRADRYRLPHPIAASGRTIEEVAIVSVPAQGRALEAREPRVAAMVPLARPLLVSGLSPRAAQFLRTWVEPWDLHPIEGAAGASTEIRPPLVPGSAIGVQLLRGDLNAVAIGTLTYRQGDSIVAFGHPFLNRGRTGYLLTAASIHEVVRSAAFPFKVGSAGAPVGVVLEDRRAGIGGRLGVLPPMVGVRARVTDRDRGRAVTLGTQVVRDPQVGPLLVLVSAIEAVDRALDRVGEGTARVRLTLRARGLDGPLVRENVFYHARDIGSAALLELPEALRLLFANEFVRTGPVDVTVEAEVEQTRKTASVVEAVPERSRLRRGETAVVRVTLRPFQGEAEVRSVEVPVLQGFPLGPATLLVRAGGRPLPEQGVMALLSAEPGEAPAPSASAQVALFAERDRNTDVVVELIPGAARFPEGGSAGTVQPVRVRLTTPWVVRGRVQVPLTIDAP
ncbi:MAG: SpoIVB peptidase S55 domain-containing protein [Armatimonadota bacterium]|nr:SpoIVB peptidase S55 domain-containing protein [Armatimonadota bacterium]MDR7519309.1 SpoIVB peptidase S55 domain-containing protein [Armatimonadota bacterium]MDR7550158.1 SpoIVB peptidase S55 domain-containing protein [Armatimonadota bacterium]